MRGAKLDKETLSLYSARLAREPFDDVITALEQISEMPREQYETALPDMGTILELVKGCGIARQHRETAAKDQEYIGWKCRICKGVVADFYPVARRAHLEVRYCQRQSQKPEAKQGEICGGNLDVVHREATA
jgi:hypothetical protein